MLIDIGYRQIFVSSASAHFFFPSPSYSHGLVNNKQDAKHISSLFNGRSKKSIKKSVTLPYSKNGSRSMQVPKPSLFSCVESVDHDMHKMEKSRHLNPFKNLKSRKETLVKERQTTTTTTTTKIFDDVDSIMNSNRLAIEFPMVLNVGSIYSSHIILYLDP